MMETGKMIEQYFCHYEKWEDFQAGMYRVISERDKDIMVINAISLLKNQNEFYSAMKELISKWQTATKVNLTNNSINKRAWLGAAACCFIHNTPEYLTRIAWNLLNKEIQDAANETAEKIIVEYNSQNAKTLFDN